MGKFTEEDINRILDLHSADGKLIDIFDLHGILFIGNCRHGGWNLEKTHVKFSEHYIAFSIEDFDDCETEEDVVETFAKCLEEYVCNKLV